MAMGIYVIKNILDNKCYIGSSNNIDKRFKAHIWKLSKNIHSNLHLQRAYNRVGKDNFIFHILEEINDVDDLAIAENWWVSGIPKDELYNIRIIESATNRGIKYSDETKQKIGAGNRGKIVSDETKRKQSLAKKGKPPTNIKSLRKSVLQIEKTTGDVIREWESILQVQKELGFDNSSISSACRGTRNKKSAYGYIWKYKLEGVMTND